MSGSYANGLVTQPLGIIRPGDYVTVVLDVIPTLPGVISNTVTVTAVEPDHDAANSSSTVATTLVTPPGVIQFHQANTTATETDGTSQILIDRVGGYQGDVTVHFSTIPGGDATPGLDYQPASVTVDFPQGVTEETVSVAVLHNPFDNHDEIVDLQLDTVTGGGSLGFPATATLQIIDIDPVRVGPTVTDFRLIGPVSSITSIEVDTTGNLNPASATNARNYTITALGGGHGLPAGTVVPVALATYNASSGAVTLTPSRPLPGNELFEVDINGTRPGAVTDRAGNPLNSVLGATPASDYSTTVARGTNVVYTDENGAAVRLKLSGPGTLDIDRTVNGRVDRLQVVGPVPRRTVISGSVLSGATRTTFGTILGLGQFGAILTKLDTPPFYITNTVYPNPLSLNDPPAVDTLLPKAPKRVVRTPRTRHPVATPKHPHASAVHAFHQHRAK